VSEKIVFEFSSGGVVQEQGQLLMVKVQNLEGVITWTFPKGHVEKGENAPEAALREVLEETGYSCEIVAPFETVEYFFKRGPQLVKKKVTWFLMKPLKKTGIHDADEVIETRWVPLAEAETLAKYKSDKQLLSKLKEATI
jgi:8-oxo-dGTP pyrophosphatase MutT (NUDIX family)